MGSRKVGAKMDIGSMQKPAQLLKLGEIKSAPDALALTVGNGVQACPCTLVWQQLAAL